ncbi:MAG: glycosyltransferase [Candidatus Nanoarchaeia archaeon]|nr:glycosyltransferase [Candidatus Nanoarchaeia archaeon]MDD5239259.1 glycosyltransferase [Candidatus Nanoarchaeia archaeon]
MKEPSVTILVTLKNSASTIKQCIDSLLGLDYKKYEIFVVDAFSTDGTYEILKRYGSKIKLHQTKGWPPAAYNMALDKIKTEYTALIDGDNVVTKDWLKTLVSGFKEAGVVEAVGFCPSPKASPNKLQELLGRELEARYTSFGDYLQRAPTMNVAFKTGLARKIKFNEALRIGYDTDFSYNLSKYGKIKYIPQAIVYHYHRSTWKNFIRQQFLNGVYVPLLFKKHLGGVKGDKISKPSMIVQPFLLVLGLLAMFFSLKLGAVFLVLLASIIFYDSLRLSRSPIEFGYYILIFIFRLLGWVSGLPFGVLKVLTTG